MSKTVARRLLIDAVSARRTLEDHLPFKTALAPALLTQT